MLAYFSQTLLPQRARKTGGQICVFQIRKKGKPRELIPQNICPFPKQCSKAEIVSRTIKTLRKLLWG